eukprot:365708-Chlamydomonas_euryale.AAC.11
MHDTGCGAAGVVAALQLASCTSELLVHSVTCNGLERGINARETLASRTADLVLQTTTSRVPEPGKTVHGPFSGAASPALGRRP